jgi:hypothetical protein
MNNPIIAYLNMKRNANVKRLIEVYVENMRKALLVQDVDMAQHWSLKALSLSTQLLKGGGK